MGTPQSQLSICNELPYVQRIFKDKEKKHNSKNMVSSPSYPSEQHSIDNVQPTVVKQPTVPNQPTVGTAMP